MKKIVLGLLVIVLSALGFSKLASALDKNVASFQVAKADGSGCGSNGEDDPK